MLNLLAASALLIVTIPASSDTEFVFPQDVTVTEFTDSFGAARSGHSHRGNDLMAPKMTEVYAIDGGVVRWIRDRGTAGRYVVIDHQDGRESWYMHLNDDTPETDDGSAPISAGVAVVEGETVTAGQLIGWAGDSGNAEGSSAHTHFELHVDGSPVDPYPYLVEAYQRALEEEGANPRSPVRPV